MGRLIRRSGATISDVFDSGSPAFLATFMFLAFLAYGGWVLFRRPRR